MNPKIIGFFNVEIDFFEPTYFGDVMMVTLRRQEETSC